MGRGTSDSSWALRAGMGQSPRLILLLALAILGAVTSVDVLTPYEFGFSAFYVLPVLIATWGVGQARGLAMALLAAGLWYGVDLTSGHPYSKEFYRIWDAFNHLLSYALVAVVTGKLRTVYLREQRLGKDEARNLEGAVPVGAGGIRED